MEYLVLFVYNVRKFDSFILGRFVLNSGKVECEEIICGFSDIL